MKNSDPQSKSNIYQRYRRLSLGIKILIFMVIGLLAGIVFGEEAQAVQPLGDLFIRLFMMAAIPLVFFNLLGGLTSLTDLRSLGRISLKISLFYLSTTVLALILGLIAMHLLKPGVGMQLTEEVQDTFGQVPGVADIIVNLVPDNVFKAFSTGQMSQVVVFAVFLAITTLMLLKEQSEPLQKMFGLLARLFRNLVNLILAISPVGIGALTASTVGQHGKVFSDP